MDDILISSPFTGSVTLSGKQTREAWLSPSGWDHSSHWRAATAPASGSIVEFCHHRYLEWVVLKMTEFRLSEDSVVEES